MSSSYGQLAAGLEVLLDDEVEVEVDEGEVIDVVRVEVVTVLELGDVMIAV